MEIIGNCTWKDADNYDFLGVRVTPETSKQIQELLFTLGYGWGFNDKPEDKTIQNLDKPVLAIEADGEKHIYYSSHMDQFTKEVPLSFFIQEEDSEGNYW